MKRRKCKYPLCQERNTVDSAFCSGNGGRINGGHSLTLVRVRL
jgi:hypothetical protein